MKKRFITILAVVLAFIMSVFATGCDGCSSCAGDTALMFNNNFLGGGTSSNANIGYKEVLTYDVDFYQSHSGIDKNLNTSETFDYKFTNGVYKMTFSALSNLPESVKMEFNLGTENTVYYHLKTEFSIDAWYKVPGEYGEGGEDLDGGKLYHDTIVSEVYFLPAGQSFAPIKAISTQTQSYLFINQQPSVKQESFAFTTEFKNGTYKTTNVYDGNEQNTTSNYSIKSAIDNTQLLFALRNIEVKVDGEFSLPTIVPAYSSPQKLTIKNKSEETLSKSIVDLGENLQIPVKNLMFYRGEDSNTGCPQYAKIQKTDSSTPNSKALLIEYVAALMPYDTPFSTMGALVYTLNSVSYN